MSLNIGLILAAGKSLRYNSNKILDIMAGKPVVQYSLETFVNHNDIHEIILVVNQEFNNKIEEIIEQYFKHNNINLILGGENRHDSVLNAIKYIEKNYRNNLNNINLIIHDSARPLVSSKIISSCITKLANYKAVSTAIPVNDTVGRFVGNELEQILARENLRLLQTPQAFHWSILNIAYKSFLKDYNFKPTDETSVIKRYFPKESIFFVEGDLLNSKITYQEDLNFLVSLLKKQKSI